MKLFISFYMLLADSTSLPLLIKSKCKGSFSFLMIIKQLHQIGQPASQPLWFDPSNHIHWNKLKWSDPIHTRKTETENGLKQGWSGSQWCT